MPLYAAGTAQFTQGSRSVVGTGTSWSTTVTPGTVLAVGGSFLEVKSVEDDTHLTLVDAAAATFSGVYTALVAVDNASHLFLMRKIEEFLVNREANLEEFLDWFSGTANGGPNADGKYPITDRYGNTTLVISAAGLAAGAQQSATTATTKATDAANSASSAAGSASAAAASAADAASFEGSAVAAAAQASADSAASSATTATTKAAAAASSATTATTKASAAASSATAASGSATDAANSATAASGSAATATTKATDAANSAATATTKASDAADSATAASNSATSASASAATATTKASDASAAASAAADSANTAATAADSLTSVAGGTYASVSTATTVVAGGRYLVTSAVTLTLPAAPSNGQAVWVMAADGVEPTVAAAGGLTIMTLGGSDTSVLLDVGAEVAFVFNGTAWELRQTADYSAGGGSGDSTIRADLSTAGTTTGAALVGYKHPDSTATGRTTASRLSDVITPFDFGAVGDGVADDTAALQKFAAAVTSHDYKNPQCVGHFAVGGVIDFYYPDDSVGANGIYFNATFDVLGRVADAVIKFREKSNLTVSGSINMNLGGTSWTGRMGDIGILVDNCTGFSIEAVNITYAKVGGIIFQDRTAIYRAGKLRTWYCGTTPTDGTTMYSDTWTFGATAGSATAQRSTVTLANPVPPEFDLNYDKLLIDGQIYIVMDLTGQTATLYPALPSTATTGTAVFLIGFGVRVYGSDASAGFIGVADVLMCGTGVQNYALYPTSFGSLVTQYCGIGHMLGQATNSACAGGSVANGYFEANAWDLVQASGYVSGFRIVSTIALNPDKCACLLSFRNADDTMEPKLLSASFGSASMGGEYVSKNIYDPELAVDTERVQYVHVRNADPVTLYIGAITVTAQDLKYVNTFTAYVCGSMASGGPGSITLMADGLTVNGKTNPTITGLTGPVIIRGVHYIGTTDWTVSYSTATAA